MIFDAAGRRVWLGELRASDGMFFGAWDGRGENGQRAPSGTYLVRADFAGGVVLSSRMVLLD